MNTERDFLDNAWRDLAGIPPPPPARRMPSQDVLRRTEWDDEFEEYVRNRMIAGAFRYGLLVDNKNKYDVVRSIQDRLELYKQDRNLEHLVDTAALALVEFVKGRRNGQVMRSVDDGIHAEEATL